MRIFITSTVLVLLSFFFIFDVAKADTDIESEIEELEFTELQYEENSCIGLNYHRVREFDLIDRSLKFFSSSRELNIYSVSEDAFRNQMEWLMDKDAEFVTMEELLAFYKRGEFPERCVWVSFDDMDQTIYDNAHPILEELDIPATGFVITGEVGNENFNNLKMIDKRDLKEMEDSGIWEFESHTDKLHHLEGNRSLILTKDNQQMQRDLLTSVHYLNRNFDCSCDVLAYPYGQVNDTLVSVMEETDFYHGFTLEDKVITPDSHPYYMPRVLISENSFDTLIKNWEGFK